VRVSDSDDVFVDDMLAHYGVKGMRWGQRKDTSSSSRKSKGKKAALVGGAVVATAGAAFVAYKLSQSGSSPIKSVKTSSDVASNAAKFVAGSGSKVSMSEVHKYSQLFEGL
jgi:hypothetical protein